MDSRQRMDSKKNWEWVTEHMPKVAAQITELRQAGLGRHVDRCWREGVINGQPDWFFAREGPICLGTPFGPRPADSIIEASERRAFAAHQVVLQLALVLGGEHAR